MNIKIKKIMIEIANSSENVNKAIGKKRKRSDPNTVM